jgi:hypothetical protein
LRSRARRPPVTFFVSRAEFLRNQVIGDTSPHHRFRAPAARRRPATSAADPPDEQSVFQGLRLGVPPCGSVVALKLLQREGLVSLTEHAG